jgi:nicotinamidase-related amidase
MATALIVVDAQNVYTSSESELFSADSKPTIKRINQLIERFQRDKAPIILVRHIHKQDGSDLGRMFDYTGEPEEDFNFKEDTEEVEYDKNLTRPDNAIEVIKNRYDAFAGTDLDKHLKKAKVETVVICGFMTNFCCESTARSAHDKDYFVDFIVDATGTPGTDSMDEKKIRKVVAELLESGFARVKTTREYLQSE